MLLPLRMAWRETRAAWRHFLYFFVCIALGVGAVVGVGLFGSAMQQAVTREARALLGGDLEVRLAHALSPSGEAVLTGLADRGIAVTRVSELAAMAAVVNRGNGLGGRLSQLVELKAVGDGYPFYGTLTVEPPRPLAELLAPEPACAVSRAPRPAPCYGVVVQESLLIRLGLAVGDPLKIGEAVFTITGILRKEPDRAVSLFSLGPRVIASRAGLEAAQLVKPGSRVRERYLVRVPAGLPLDPLLYELRGRLAGESARVLPYQDAQPQLRRFLDQLTRYLGLIGLTALFVGGIGVASTVHAFLREKLQTIAILKTLGADSGAITRVYLLQTLLLGLVGSLAGAALGVVLQRLLPLLMADLLPPGAIELASGPALPSLAPLVKGIAMGLLTTLLFTLWPLLGIRTVRPSAVLRREVAPTEDPAAPGWRGRLQASGLVDPSRLLAAGGIVAGLAGLAIWQAGNWRVGLLFLSGLFAAVAALRLATGLLVHGLTRTATGARSLAVRYALGNVARPGSQAAGVVVAVGLGVMVVVTVSLLQRALVRQLGEHRPADAPSFFFIDIQPDQKDRVLELLRAQTGDASPEATPLVRSRLAAINGRPVSAEEERKPGPGRERESRATWYRSREYVLTFREELPRDNRIIRGTWWRRGEPAGRNWVSVEEDAARNLGVDLGSTLAFDIQGTTVSGEVRSIRSVQWETLSTNFFMILSPGSLEGAPVTYVATVRVPPEQEVPVQQAVVAAFPNVTAINIRDVLESFMRIVERLSLAVRAIALFCIATGGLVLAAALSTTRYRRLYESVIFKALGATRGLLACTYAIEYALLGLVGGLIGVLLASLLSWGILEWIFDLAWTLQPDVLAAGLLLTVLLTLAVGFLATFRLLGERPLAVLRQE
ncbi:ABC transporter permease [Nitrospira sp. Kam-Ns4a]